MACCCLQVIATVCRSCSNLCLCRMGSFSVDVCIYMFFMHNFRVKLCCRLFLWDHRRALPTLQIGGMDIFLFVILLGYFICLSCKEQLVHLIRYDVSGVYPGVKIKKILPGVSCETRAANLTFSANTRTLRKLISWYSLKQNYNNFVSGSTYISYSHWLRIAYTGADVGWVCLMTDVVHV